MIKIIYKKEIISFLGNNQKINLFKIYIFVISVHYPDIYPFFPDLNILPSF